MRDDGRVRISRWRFGLFWTLLAEARVALRLVREPRVPALLKAVPFLALLYVVSPVDAIPDLIPVLGQLDDLTMLLTAIQVFRRISPPQVVAYHQSAVHRKQRYAPMPATGDVIDAEFRRDDV